MAFDERPAADPQRPVLASTSAARRWRPVWSTPTDWSRAPAGGHRHGPDGSPGGGGRGGAGRSRRTDSGSWGGRRLRRPDELARGRRQSAQYPRWRAGFPLRDWLRERLPGGGPGAQRRAVHGGGETWRGAARGHGEVLGMVVSTGVGGGLILGGRLRDGATGNAGHIGHIIAEPDGPLCGCGARGCLEAVARGPAIVAWAADRGCAARDGRELGELALSETRWRWRPSIGPVRRWDASWRARSRWSSSMSSSSEAASPSAGELLFGPLRREFAAHAQLHFTRETPVLAAASARTPGSSARPRSSTPAIATGQATIPPLIRRPQPGRGRLQRSQRRQPGSGLTYTSAGRGRCWTRRLLLEPGQEAAISSATRSGRSRATRCPAPSTGTQVASSSPATRRPYSGESCWSRLPTARESAEERL